ncbi:MAG: hypothetical protein PHF29_02280 [Candidatus Riflebacteria bacterium]|nr:hypothetical protein [Candidatus Riflebacteria bacterium]MDD3000560.1 hypothetical protein [Candidatus Riflebacteria bacterium]
MRNKAIKTLVLLFFVLNYVFAFALDSNEMFENGKRAFDLSRFKECVEIFDRLLYIWPDFEDKPEALYYRSIAAIRDTEDKVNAYKAELVDKIASDCETVFLELPENDLSELKAAIAIGKMESEPLDWSQFDKIKPAELKHVLLRRHHPSVQRFPVQTLIWLNGYKNKNSVLTPDVEALTELLKLKALWQLLLSPLNAKAEEETLKQNNVWPLAKTFEQTLDNGFKKALPSLKREFALMGYHYDYLRSNEFGKETKKEFSSIWLKYLKERGLNLKEAVCPY